MFFGDTLDEVLIKRITGIQFVNQIVIIFNRNFAFSSSV